MLENSRSAHGTNGATSIMVRTASHGKVGTNANLQLKGAQKGKISGTAECSVHGEGNVNHEGTFARKEKTARVSARVAEEMSTNGRGNDQCERNKHGVSKTGITTDIRHADWDIIKSKSKDAMVGSHSHPSWLLMVTLRLFPVSDRMMSPLTPT